MAATGLYAGERWAGVMWRADDFPWAAVAAACFGLLLIWESIRIITAKKDDEPLTVGKYRQELAANNLELQSIRDAATRLPMEPLGSDGATLGRLPDGANLVKLSDGSFRLALPIHLSANEIITIVDSVQLEKRDDG